MAKTAQAPHSSISHNLTKHQDLSYTLPKPRSVIQARDLSHDGRTSTIPFPSSHIPRTDSEQQLRDNMEAAEWRDRCMFDRLVSGIRQRQKTQEYLLQHESRISSNLSTNPQPKSRLGHRHQAKEHNYKEPCYCETLRQNEKSLESIIRTHNNAVRTHLSREAPKTVTPPPSELLFPTGITRRRTYGDQYLQVFNNVICTTKDLECVNRPDGQASSASTSDDWFIGDDDFFATHYSDFKATTQQHQKIKPCLGQRTDEKTFFSSMTIENVEMEGEVFSLEL